MSEVNRHRVATPEFWRFVFVMAMVFGHFEDDYLGFGNNFIAIGGYLGVEFFLLLSGFAITLQYERSPMDFNPRDNWLKRFRSIYPDYLWAIFIMFVVWCATEATSMQNIIHHLYRNRLQFILAWPFLKCGGLEMRSLWYVSYWLFLYGVIALNIRCLRSGGGEWLRLCVHL